VLQDFTGVPCVVDLAAMRDAMKALGGDPNKINPLIAGRTGHRPLRAGRRVRHADALAEQNARSSSSATGALRFLRWGQKAFDNFKVVPPNTGIVHQVNLEYLARVVMTRDGDGELQAYPDTVVGTDSHTTMINGLGVLGWGVGGIEAEAAMLGQPVTMLIPQVVGFKLTGKLPEGATATDLVLTVTEMLRKNGVVGKFVEFFGPASPPAAGRPRDHRQHGAGIRRTCGIFPIDAETLRYLRCPAARRADRAGRGLCQGAGPVARRRPAPTPNYTDTLELDLATSSLAGRPQAPAGPRAADRRARQRQAATCARPESTGRCEEAPAARTGTAAPRINGQTASAEGRRVVIAAITSCTNTSNPAVMLGAGLLARNAAPRA
jgi:aconitate hydratase